MLWDIYMLGLYMMAKRPWIGFPLDGETQR